MSEHFDAADVAIVIEELEDGAKNLTVTPLDECCFDIRSNGEHIGVWCPKSHRVVIDGEIVGFAKTKEEVLGGLAIRDVPAWTMRPNA